MERRRLRQLGVLRAASRCTGVLATRSPTRRRCTARRSPGSPIDRRQRDGLSYGVGLRYDINRSLASSSSTRASRTPARREQLRAAGRRSGTVRPAVPVLAAPAAAACRAIARHSRRPSSCAIIRPSPFAWSISRVFARRSRRPANRSRMTGSAEPTVATLLDALRARGGAFSARARRRPRRPCRGQSRGGDARRRRARRRRGRVVSAGHRRLTMPVRVQREAFDAGAEIDKLRAGDRRVGAVASFIGTVRDVNDDAAVRTLTLEHYPGHDREGARGDRRRGEAALRRLRDRASSIASASLRPPIRSCSSP